MPRVPRTSNRRQAGDWARLLIRVDPSAVNGYGFEGPLLRPGAEIAEEKLFPPGTNPDFAVVLECAGSTGSGWGHDRSPYAWVLWRYDRGGDWRELARASAVDSSWTLDLGPIAIRALAAGKPKIEVEVEAERITRMVEQELDRLTAEAMLAVVAKLHNRLNARVVRSREF